MKTIVFGDIHGHNTWKDIIDKESPDKVVFLGDYFDSFNPSLTSKIQLENYREIKKLKNKLGDSCVILLGNHDFHYIDEREKYSGFKLGTFNLVHDELCEDYKNNIILPIHIMDNIIFSHAGVSKVWMNEIAKIKSLDEINNTPKENFRFNFLGGWDPYGNSPTQSPIWIRPTALLNSKFSKYKQIVGHTHFKTPVEQDNIWFNDSLPDYYIEILNSNITFKSNK